MKKAFETIHSNKLYSGGFLFLAGGMISNFISYIYHLIFGRILGPAEYGNLALFVTILGICLAFFSTLGTVITKFSADYDPSERSKILTWLDTVVFKILAILCVLLVAISPFVSNVLNIPIESAVLFPPIIFFSALTMLYGSVLQGSLQFDRSVIVTIFSNIARLVSGVVIFAITSKFAGIILGILIAYALSFLLAKNYIRKITSHLAKSKFDTKKLFKYSLPVLVTAVATGSLFSMDFIMVKLFISPHDAGVYGAVSIIGKLIFYSLSPLYTVVFSLSARGQSEGKRTRWVFLQALSFTAAASLAANVLFSLVPNLLITFIYGPEFQSGYLFLTPYSIYMSLFTISILISNYLLSLGFTKTSIFVSVSAVVQILGILMFHASISQIINVSIFSGALLFILNAGYALKQYK